MATAAHGADARRTAATTRAILASSLAWFMVTLDFFAAQTALPAMAADPDTTVTTVQWVISGYMSTMSSFYIIGGRRWRRSSRPSRHAPAAGTCRPQRQAQHVRLPSVLGTTHALRTR